jgi:tRNA-dihydrouridine synthase B
LSGVRTARKHIGWYVSGLPGGSEFRQRMNSIDDAAAQSAAVSDFFEQLGLRSDRMPVDGQALTERRDTADLMETT